MWIHPNSYKKRIITVVCIFAVMLLLLFVILKSCDSNPSSNEPKEEVKTLDFIPADDSTDERITIPGVSGLYLKCGQLNQTVDFYNPNKNNCLFKISLYLSDETLLFESDYIKPGEHLNDITISEPLKQGVYQNCILLYKCFSIDGKTQYNGSQFKVEINSIK